MWDSSHKDSSNNVPLVDVFSHGNVVESDQQRRDGYLSETAYDYVRPENMVGTSRTRAALRKTTMDDIAKDKNLAWGHADEVTS